MTALYDISARRLDGTPEMLGHWRDHVLLVVNTASRCGFTPQYAGLEALQRRFGDRGFTVLGFPCNQFGRQEPGGEAEIGTFCQVNYGVSFPMYAKVEVNGAGTHPLFRYLKRARPGLLGSGAIKWNFTKFLIDRRGDVVARYAPTTRPETLGPAIEEGLKA